MSAWPKLALPIAPSSAGPKVAEYQSPVKLATSTFTSPVLTPPTCSRTAIRPLSPPDSRRARTHTRTSLTCVTSSVVMSNASARGPPDARLSRM